MTQKRQTDKIILFTAGAIGLLILVIWFTQIPEKIIIQQQEERTPVVHKLVIPATRVPISRVLRRAQVPFGLASSAFATCKDKCGSPAESGSCYCDLVCTQYGDCCADYKEYCKGKEECPSVYKPVCGKDGQTYENECNALKAGTSITCYNKCPCSEQDKTCKESCGGISPGGCYCDSACEKYGDCCADYKEVCKPKCPEVYQPVCGFVLNKNEEKTYSNKCEAEAAGVTIKCDGTCPCSTISCNGYCGGKPSTGNCYCDSLFEGYEDCCEDYKQQCKGKSQSEIKDTLEIGQTKSYNVQDKVYEITFAQLKETTVTSLEEMIVVLNVNGKLYSGKQDALIELPEGISIKIADITFLKSNPPIPVVTFEIFAFKPVS